MLEGIKKLFFNFALSRIPEKAAKTGKAPYSHIGILYDATDEKRKTIVLKYAAQLTKSYKSITLLAYINQKIEKDLERTFDFYAKSDLNWYGKPTHSFIDSFVNKEIDIFINLLPHTYKHQEFILKRISPIITIGPHNHDHSYDIEIDDDTEDLKRYLDHMMAIFKQLGIYA